MTSPRKEHEGEGNMWSLEFVAVVAVACVAIGILIGVLITCLYNKYTCFRRGDNLLTRNVPSSAYRCFPVDNTNINCHRDASVFTIGNRSPDCHDNGPTACSPPSYQAQPSPLFPHRTVNPNPNLRLFSPCRQRFSVDTPDNLSGRQTPGSLARSSQADLEHNRLAGTRSQVIGITHPLSTIASLSGQPDMPMARQTGSHGSRYSLNGSYDEQRRAGTGTNNDQQREMISLQEFSLNRIDPQALLENAPPLDSTSFLERVNNNNTQRTQGHLSNSQNQSNRSPSIESQNISLNLLPFRSPEMVGKDATAAAAAAAAAAASTTSSETPKAMNNLQEDVSSKCVPSKQIPYGSIISLPDGTARSSREDAPCEIECLKIFDSYPDDIKTIFEPVDASKMITVRQKKVVYDCKKLDCRGGLLKLDNTGISLVVLPGAIPDGQSSLVTLVLNWDLTDNPPMDRREALVSPVVYCGPHSTKFQKPCLLKFRHCAFDNRYAKLMTSETGLFENKDWNDFDILDDNNQGERNQHSLYNSRRRRNVAITVDECQVEISHFSLYTCILRSKHLHMKKWLQVAVFTHTMTASLQHQLIRVYFLNKTPCALQWAIQNEAEHGYRLACPENTFLFHERGEDLWVKLSYLSDGWNMISEEKDGETANVLFEEIWHGKCPHVCMSFKRNSSTTGTPICPTVAKKDGGVGPDSDVTASNELSLSGGTTERCVAVAESHAVEGGERKIVAASSSSAEMSICLKLSQLRCENVYTDVHILMYDSMTAKVIFPDEEETFAMKLE